jgi:cytochrome c553
MIIRALLGAAAVLLLGAGAAALADPERDRLLRYGEHLAQECVSCHRRDGKDVGIPGIVAMSEAEFVNAMMLYKTGRRANKVMVSVSASLDDTQIRALAAYFTTLPRR